MIPFFLVHLKVAFPINHQIIKIYDFFKTSESDCEYRYTEQPQINPSCSPYGDVMRIDCTVEVPRDASNISIGWFLDCMELSNDSHVAIRSQDQYTDTVRQITSQLVITDINDDYAGEYTCNILGDEEFIPSNLFRMPNSTELEVERAIGLCPSNYIFSIEEVKCAEITENRTIPLSLSCADPVAATSHTGTTTSPTPVIQPTPTTIVTTSLHHNSTFSLIPLPVPTTTVPTTTDSSDTSSSDYTTVWTYAVAVVAAVLLLIIIVMLVLYVKIYFKRHKGE